MMLDRPSRTARWIALIAPALLLSGAYLSQYGFGLVPCEMCWWQRYPHFAALALALLAFVIPRAARPLTVLAALAILASGLIGGFHAGVEWGWWPGPSHCTVSASTGGDALSRIMNTPLVRCDVAQWRFAGLSLAAWNFIASSAAAIAIALCLISGQRASGRRATR
jgi:disulfide bond formation protein DsbB